MEYERIHKVQTGVISPSKLRMKMLVAHKSIRKGINSNSSRTSPIKNADMEYAKNCLLPTARDPDEVARPGESVLMRDIGTEMTPISTPLGSITPTRSPIDSIASTPRGGGVASSSTEAAIDKLNIQGTEGLSERKLKLRTRREIAALGIQLGKTRIATWASKEEAIHSSLSTKIPDVNDEKVVYEARAAAWEEAKNSEHQARYKSEEVKIQAWETNKKEKFEAEMKTVEAKLVQMRAHALEKMSEKLVLIQKQVEEKEAAASARMNKQAARIARKADRMRRTGKFSSSNFLCCSGYF